MATSGSGERRARRGLRYQDRASALLIHTKITDGTLKFITIADDNAGIFDDLIIGDAECVIAHQYKSSIKPTPVGVKSLLLGKSKMIFDCAASFLNLRDLYPEHKLILKYVTSHYPSVHDVGSFGVEGKSSADLFEALRLHSNRSLANWSETLWKPVIQEFQQVSGLGDEDFEGFLSAFILSFGAPSTIDLNTEVNPQVRDQVKHIGSVLNEIIGSKDDKTRWSRHELLDELEWRDQFANRFEHRFPLGHHVQRNEITEKKVHDALSAHDAGYISLIGPPGAGKSTLIERSVLSGPFLKVVRYLAYVPGSAQGLGRGEAIHFLSDLNGQLRRTGLADRSANDGEIAQAQATFERLLRSAADRYEQTGVKTVIVVDGLDHIPREERPTVSFLTLLPRPQDLPVGVIILLGSQRVDLSDMPLAVRSQASELTRKIEMAPLPELSVEKMIQSVGLNGHVTAREVWQISQGHPLVTQYLLARLQNKSPSEREELLAGEFVYEGDIDAVYSTVWKGATEGQGAVQRVLRMLGYVEGQIEPELLAEHFGDQPVEDAYEAAHHLLDIRHGRWTPFHNSFRLFLQNQTILKFGKPDNSADSTSIYVQLAKLASQAPLTSEQRWLTFRYTLLSGELEVARQIACRAYFMAQFISGRHENDISRDIEDAFGCYGVEIPPDVLFDLLLAKDELYRRKDAISMSSHLVEAQIAAGCLDAAEAQLDLDHTEGDVYRVIEAFLEHGFVDRARRLFDREQPWKNFDDIGSHSAVALQSWADFATIFLDHEQIMQRLSLRSEISLANPLPLGVSPASDVGGRIRMTLALARIRHDTGVKVEDVAKDFDIPEDHAHKLFFESAISCMDAGDNVTALKSLKEAYRRKQSSQELSANLQLTTCRMALDLGDKDFASEVFATIPPPALNDLEYKSEYVASRVNQVVGYCAVATRLGQNLPNLDQPEQTVFKLMQTHCRAIGAILGDIASGTFVRDGSVKRSIDSALRFIGRKYGAFSEKGRQIFGARHGDKALFDIIRITVSRRPDLVADFEYSSLEHIFSSKSQVSRSLDFHIDFMETIYEITQDAVRAVNWLEDGRTIITMASSPQEEIDCLAQLALAFAKVGRLDKAELILSEMRAVSLGIYAAAKKDGQYQVWSEFLIAANRADPVGAASRSVEVLQLLAGVYESDGSDQATRAGKEVLVEALGSKGGAHAMSVFNWAYDKGFFSWADLIDAQCRALLRRQPDLAGPIAVAWSCLCLPYYDEVYNSLTDTGAFLREVATVKVSATHGAAIHIIIDGLQRNAKPELRVNLLRTLRDALEEAGLDIDQVSSALARWEPEQPFEDPSSYRSNQLPDYASVTDFKSAESAVQDEVARRKKHKGVSYGNLVNGTLADRIAQVVKYSPWDDIFAFAQKHPKLLEMTVIRDAIAQAAQNFGEKEYAAQLILPPPKDRTGWGGWSGRGSLQYHQGRHLLGCSDAFKTAREEFVSSLSQGDLGTGTALWDLHTILGVLYPKDQLDFSKIWKPLGEQIPHYRDYQHQDPIPTEAAENCTDLEMLMGLFIKAANLSISDIHEQVRNSAALLKEHEWHEEFTSLCQGLIGEEGDQIVLGVRCMLDASHSAAISKRLVGELQGMSDCNHAIVAAASHVLSQRWGHPLEITRKNLPFVYELEHPQLDTERNHNLIDPRTRSPVIDDPAVWTVNFLSDFERLSDFSGVPINTLRHRAYHLISEWGGIDAYGANATKHLENEYTRLGLRLFYINPHAGIVIRAFYAVLNEVWRAGKISSRDLDILLSFLGGSPLQPPWHLSGVRPFDQSWPTIPSAGFSTDDEKWLEEKSFHRTGVEARTLASISNFSLLRGRTHSEEGTLMWRGSWSPETDENLSSDNLAAKLPKTAWLLGQTCELAEKLPHLSSVNGLSTSVIGARDTLVVFDPFRAEQLGWSTVDGDPLQYYHPEKGLMVRTVIWRDGWAQPMEYGDRQWAFGQTVILSDSGLEEFKKANLYADARFFRTRQQKSQDQPKGFAKWSS